jgi:hypothetical protein
MLANVSFAQEINFSSIVSFEYSGTRQGPSVVSASCPSGFDDVVKTFIGVSPTVYPESIFRPIYAGTYLMKGVMTSTSPSCNGYEKTLPFKII